MTSASRPARGPRVCMLAYFESPSTVPPMFNTGLSLARDGFEVEALCLASSDGAPRVEAHAPGFTTRRLSARVRGLFRALFGQARPRRLVAGIQYGLSYLEYVGKAFLAALRARADLYEANDLPPLLPALLAAKVRRKPIVYRAHELWSETHAKVPFARIWRALDRLLVPRCDLVVTPDAFRSRIYQEELGARRPPLTVRNCPPLKAPVESTLLRDELRRRGVAFTTVVLYQGLIDSMRCIEEIAEATRHFDDGVVLVTIGAGWGKWADPATALAGYDRIVALPRVRYEELLPYTASADIGVLLYRNDCRNNFYCAPNKVFEYAMMGLPVVSTDFPGMKAHVEGSGVGLCVNPEDPAAIAAAVNRLARDPALRARMRETGHRLSRERDNWELESQPLLERYRTLTGAPPGGR